MSHMISQWRSKEVGKSFSNKRRNILFSSEEKATYLNKEMLTDESINIAQNILKKEFPKLLDYKIQSLEKMRRSIYKYFTQDHFCVANTQRNKTDRSYCQIYDSLTNGSVPVDVA